MTEASSEKTEDDEGRGRAEVKDEVHELQDYENEESEEEDSNLEE
jgi:hypothetical protein